ncbi:MAG: hypothetical protein ACM3OB_07055, partial [Acidobacteriota bacterium]
MVLIEKLLASIARGEVQPVYLVHGDLVLAEPAALRIGEALAAPAGCAAEVHRRPARLAPLLEDLRTYSLFAPAKVIVAVDSAVLAERGAAADLVDQAAEALPLPAAGLGPRERPAASRLLQALRLFGVDPLAGEPAAAIAALPGWALEGGEEYRKRRAGRKRPKGEAEKLEEGLAGLLRAAREEGLVGYAEGDLAELAAILSGGLPRGHALVLAESSAAASHPLVEALGERQAILDVGAVEAERGGGWQGVERLAEELERQTGVAVARDALAELVRRTLRQGDQHADSTARFAAEYRKLAELSAGGRISRPLVERSVEDRGEEDVWQILDAIAAGHADEALERTARLLRGADDAIATRLSFFALLAGFCRQLVAVGGLLDLLRLPRGETSYNRFKGAVAPALQGEIPGGHPNPLAGLHPFRLHRVYLAASRWRAEELRLLPWRLLETELRIKGDS